MKTAIAALCVFSGLTASAFADDPMPKNTIYPAEDAPDFIKAQWKDVVDKGPFPLPKRDWKEAPLPSGLEEQVWAAFAPGAQPVWRNISPGYVNVSYDAKVDNGVISVFLDVGGLVQSNDGGRTWRQVSHHLTPGSYQSFDISPANPDIIAVTGTRIDRTLNGGRSWSTVCEEALPPFAAKRKVSFGRIRFNADGSRVFAAPGAFGHGYGPRGGIEPAMSEWLKRKLVYVGDGQVANFKSIDLGAFAAIRCVATHFSDPNLVYLAYSDGSFYVCRDAKSESPSFVKLETPDAMKGYQAVCLDIAPDDSQKLLVALLEQSALQNSSGSSKSKLVLARVSGDKLSCEPVDIGVKDGIGSAKWNPRNPQQVFVGLRWGRESIRVSDNGMKTFRSIRFPEELYHAEPGAPDKTFAGYASPHKFEFDRKSDLAIARSVTGAWLSHDGFKSMKDLFMTYDPVKKLYGNKGVGFAECGVSLFIRKNYSYIDTNDHGAWRSDGKDTSKWLRISANPGMPAGPDGEPFRGLCFPMGVSMDEKYVYLVAKAGYLHADGKAWMDNSQQKSRKAVPSEYSDGFLKLMLSRDKGDTWTDVTARLGQGEFFEALGPLPTKIDFDPLDSKRQWIFLSDKMYVSSDGGETFKPSSFPGPIRYCAYDQNDKVFYVAIKSGVYRSSDFSAASWTRLPFDIVPYALGVLSNGDLAVSDDGRLMVVPKDKIDGGRIEQSMIKLTVGGSLAAAAAGQRTFRPIVCDGMDILTFTDDGWNSSDAVRPLGPLLSRDGGKSFQWIAYDLQGHQPNIEMRDGKIMLGGRGIYELDLRALNSNKTMAK